MYSPQEQMMWHRLLAAGRPKLAWFPHYPVPILARRQKAIVTIYDLLHSATVADGGPGGLRRGYADAMVRATASGSARVLTISEFTKRQLEAGFPRLQGRVSVTQMEVGPEWFEQPPANGRPGSPPYFIFVGNVVRQKDVGTLLAAFHMLSNRVDVELVIVGGGLSTRSTQHVLLEAARNCERIRVLGNVPFHELRSLVAGAVCLVMPSLYEGLGLPPLEAMAVGTPCIVSDAPALVEGCGKAALVFKRGNIAELAELMSRVANDAELRERMRSRGYEQVADRTRERAVAELSAVVRNELVG